MVSRCWSIRVDEKMDAKDDILRDFALFSTTSSGIGSWLTNETNDEVFQRLSEVDTHPLPRVQLNQLLALGHEAPLSRAFYRYYWLQTPDDHPYDPRRLPGFVPEFLSGQEIGSLEHLKWGMYRLYVDSLLWFGNIRTGYRWLRSKNETELQDFFLEKRFDTELIRGRGPSLGLAEIAKDNRYLISEMACKSYGDSPMSSSELKEALFESFRSHSATGGGPVTIRSLLEGQIPEKFSDRQGQFIFSADDVLEEMVETEDDIEKKYEAVADKFFDAREAALRNTNLYLSMVGDLDVYVATSMRTRQDFRDMADFCDAVFDLDSLSNLNIRYFDPTLSAASGHEDKGLIECLMVKCAKVLVYCAGDKESYGKDAEAAMALSLGKPVIFYCDQEQRKRFYRDVHPLSRLIEFETGVAVGAMVTDKPHEVSELLRRIFENQMEYELEKPKPNYLRLKEKLTDSVVRLQTSDQMVSETFWNYYHNR